MDGKYTIESFSAARALCHTHATVCRRNRRVLAFTDSQLRAVWAATDRIPVEKRGVFLERVVARLQLQRGFTDADVDDAVRAALTGLIQSAA